MDAEAGTPGKMLVVQGELEELQQKQRRCKAELKFLYLSIEVRPRGLVSLYFEQADTEKGLRGFRGSREVCVG